MMNMKKKNEQKEVYEEESQMFRKMNVEKIKE